MTPRIRVIAPRAPVSRIHLKTTSTLPPRSLAIMHVENTKPKETISLEPSANNIISKPTQVFLPLPTRATQPTSQLLPIELSTAVTTIDPTQGAMPLYAVIAKKVARIFWPPKRSKTVKKEQPITDEEKVLQSFNEQEKQTIKKFHQKSQQIQEILSRDAQAFLKEYCKTHSKTSTVFTKRKTSKGVSKWFRDGKEEYDAPHSQTGHLQTLAKMASSTDCDIILLDSGPKKLASLARKIEARKAKDQNAPKEVTLDWLIANIKDSARICFLGPPELNEAWHKFIMEKGLTTLQEKWCLNGGGFPCAKEVTFNKTTGIKYETMFEPRMSPFAFQCLSASHICYEVSRLNLTRENVTNKQKSKLLLNYNVIANIVQENIEKELFTTNEINEFKLRDITPIIKTKTKPDPLNELMKDFDKIIARFELLRFFFNQICVNEVKANWIWKVCFEQEIDQAHEQQK